MSAFLSMMRIIGYSSVDKVLQTAPDLDEIDISSEISLILKRRGCAGRWEDERYLPCNSEEAPYCAGCGGPPDPCVMCRGECLRTDITCDVEHSVYLAIFAPDLVKVGVSKTHRLETRLREQGADIGLEIARYPDGRLARQRERMLAATYPDRVTFEKKLAGVSQVVNGETVRMIYGRFEAERVLRFEYFRERPWMTPILLGIHENMAISGRVLGVKGQALVIEKGNSLYAVNLDSLVGYDVETGKGSVNLQTSLLEFS
jgi:hypothetical protein